jgi:hypothetical protein
VSSGEVVQNMAGLKLCYENRRPRFCKERDFVGWETRERGTRYYTRSKWVDGRVVREYVGGGVLGKIAALEDEHKRLQKQETVAHWTEQQKHLERDAAFLKELEEVTEILTRACLIAAGCHRRRGEWRRRREQHDA